MRWRTAYCNFIPLKEWKVAGYYLRVASRRAAGAIAAKRICNYLPLSVSALPATRKRPQCFAGLNFERVTVFRQKLAENCEKPPQHRTITVLDSQSDAAIMRRLIYMNVFG
ncbi:hypothetical protein KCP69_22690 [Salmonella enterica subsp. enterica]|nr:hypothetical protein KCP69_22690 [Salmonella enterica subsp. enterica]